MIETPPFAQLTLMYFKNFYMPSPSELGSYRLLASIRDGSSFLP
jgi:hypothetical protein